jgi:hypothetical protein
MYARAHAHIMDYQTLPSASWAGAVPWGTHGTLRGKKGAIMGNDGKQRQRLSNCFYCSHAFRSVAFDGTVTPF